ncbi:AcrB/AcrD/AcrF family protein [Anopheles sinensis]|uniref:AcrB/AcrD/AcrF family protein n=1 Tax=Anopheles sinensis TaxID=74873 RepID=A0A084VEI1_ANOSI|nr:AcrB/AcrD/AcrF family protein [Anopheles sinensis]
MNSMPFAVPLALTYIPDLAPWYLKFGPYATEKPDGESFRSRPETEQNTDGK